VAGDPHIHRRVLGTYHRSDLDRSPLRSEVVVSDMASKKKTKTAPSEKRPAVELLGSELEMIMSALRYVRTMRCHLMAKNIDVPRSDSEFRAFHKHNKEIEGLINKLDIIYHDEDDVDD
jgi:alpha-D-ribose 1-methylphosphonate 5-triphosphate synthase subunit PhnI